MPAGPRTSLLLVPSIRRAGSTRLADRLTTTPLTARRAGRIIAVVTLVLAVVGAVLLWAVDREEFPNLGLALWWSVQTVTTVGYGDFVPGNTAGRIIGGLVMLVGIGFLAVVTASIAAIFVESRRREVAADAPDEHPLAPRIEEILVRLDRLEKAVSRAARTGPRDDDR